MYNIIKEIINHTWVSQSAGDQQYIYTIAGTCIIVLSVVCVDLLYRTIMSLVRH